jgi:uncharacterized membrane protein
MRDISCLFIIIVISCCKEPGQIRKDTVSQDEVNLIQTSTLQDSLFTKLDAEKILGEPAHLTDSATTLKADTLEYRSVYTADSKDPKTGKTGVIYFLFNQYARASIAQMIYSSIKTSNQNHQGFQTIHDMGDEAYFHSDGQNFYFIIVRKGEKLFRMKVNKTTSTTSLAAFNQTAKNITAAL